MSTKLQNAVGFVKRHPWKFMAVVGGAAVLYMSPVVQCPITFSQASMLRQKMAKGDMITGIALLGEAFGLRQKALDNSCQHFTWMIPDPEARKTMDEALEPVDFNF